MAVNFCPNREQMIQEVDRCVAANMRQVLVSLCECCVYKSFNESILVSECRMCSVRQGIAKLSRGRVREDEADAEFLGVC